METHVFIFFILGFLILTLIMIQRESVKQSVKTSKAKEAFINIKMIGAIKSKGIKRACKYYKKGFAMNIV